MMADVVQDASLLLATAWSGLGEALGQALETCLNYLLLIAGKQLDPELHAKGSASDPVQKTFLEAQRDFTRFQGTSQLGLLVWLPGQGSGDPCKVISLSRI